MKAGDRISAAAYQIRARAERIEQKIDAGALDSTADEIEPVTLDEVERARRPEGAR